MYINLRDIESVKKEKAKWREEFIAKEPWFDMNRECVQYCEMDVLVLIKSSLKFTMHAFQFGEEMIACFGKSPAYREGLSMQHIVPFQKSIPTIGSYV